MQSPYSFMRARWWPGAASLLGLLAAHPGHAQTTLNNPAATALASLWVTSPAAATGTLTILNALGQVVATRSPALAEGTQELPLALQNLPAGVYTLRLQTNGRTATTRLLMR
jgi:hypothetical protein